MAGGGHVVLSTVLYTLDEEGERVVHLRGDTLTGLSKTDVARFIAAGAIAEAGDDAAKAAKAAPVEQHPADLDPAAGEPERHETVPRASEIVDLSNSTPVPVKPAKAATKEAWASYAVSSGQLTDEEAKAKTREQLRDELR